MIVESYVFFIWKLRITLRGAYRFFGVKKNTYAGSVVERIYDCYCKGAQSAYLTYLKYYRKEFPTFAKYLEGKFNLFPNEVNQIQSIFLFYKIIDYKVGDNTMQLLEDDAMLGILHRFLGGVIDED